MSNMADMKTSLLGDKEALESVEHKAKAIRESADKPQTREDLLAEENKRLKEVFFSSSGDRQAIVKRLSSDLVGPRLRLGTANALSVRSAACIYLVDDILAVFASSVAGWYPRANSNARDAESLPDHKYESTVAICELMTILTKEVGIRAAVDLLGLRCAILIMNDKKAAQAAFCKETDSTSFREAICKYYNKKTCFWKLMDKLWEAIVPKSVICSADSHPISADVKAAVQMFVLGTGGMDVMSLAMKYMGRPVDTAFTDPAMPSEEAIGAFFKRWA